VSVQRWQRCLGAQPCLKLLSDPSVEVDSDGDADFKRRDESIPNGGIESAGVHAAVNVDAKAVASGECQGCSTFNQLVLNSAVPHRPPVGIRTGRAEIIAWRSNDKRGIARRLLGCACLGR